MQVREHPLAQHSEQLKDMLIDALLHQRRNQANVAMFQFPTHGAGLGGWGGAAADAMAAPAVPGGSAGGSVNEAGQLQAVTELSDRLGSGNMC